MYFDSQDQFLVGTENNTIIKPELIHKQIQFLAVSWPLEQANADF